MKKGKKKVGRGPREPKTMGELSDFYDAHQDDESLWAKKPIRVQTPKEGSVVFSVRFSPSELEDLRHQADARGVTLSEIIRAGAIEWAKERSFTFTVLPAPDVSVAGISTRSLEFADVVIEMSDDLKVLETSASKAA